MVGSLRDRITVRTPVVETTELNGYEITDWTTYDTWASVDVMKGLRSLEYLRLLNKIPYVVTVRSRLVNPTAECRLTWKGKDLKVHSITSKSKADFVELIAYSEEAAT
jgi:head-tail adaptor